MRRTLYFILLVLLCFGCDYEAYRMKLTNTIEEIGLAKTLCAVVIDSYKNVWNTAIEDKTYEGHYCNDYNKALSMHYKKIQSLDSFKKLTENVLKIEQSVKELKDYPSKYKDAYNELVDIFTDLNELYNYADSPQGSLITYSSKTFDLYQQLTKKIKEFKIKYTE